MSIFTDLRTYCNMSKDDVVEAMTNMRDMDKDFETGGYLFVHENNIAEYLADYLSNDEYSLGCFTPWFLSSELEIPSDVIESMQQAEAFEAIGKLVLWKVDMVEFADSAMSHDGAGHFLNHEDGSQLEIGEYLAFQRD